MSKADDFMDNFFKEYPQAKSGKLSLEELNVLMADYQHKINQRPLEDFDGLSPEEMHFLLRQPLAPMSMLQLREGVGEHLHKVPFFALSELLIQEIAKAKSLKLTSVGNLPVKVCEMLYNQRLIEWEYMESVKRIREDEIPYILYLRHYLLNEGIVKKRNNALSLTKKGQELMKKTSFDRFHTLLNYFTTRLNWENFYELEDGGKCGNVGWAYSLILLSRYGDVPRESEFYSLKLMRAFEPKLWQMQQEHKEGRLIDLFHRAYSFRFFDCFANWFGLVNIEYKKTHRVFPFREMMISRSVLFDQLFTVVKKS